MLINVKMPTVVISSRDVKTSENTDVFKSPDEIYLVFTSKKVSILYIVIVFCMWSENASHKSLMKLSQMV